MSEGKKYRNIAPEFISLIETVKKASADTKSTRHPRVPKITEIRVDWHEEGYREAISGKKCDLWHVRNDLTFQGRNRDWSRDKIEREIADAQSAYELGYNYGQRNPPRGEKISTNVYRFCFPLGGKYAPTKYVKLAQ